MDDDSVSGDSVDKRFAQGELVKDDFVKDAPRREDPPQTDSLPKAVERAVEVPSIDTSKASPDSVSAETSAASAGTAASSKTSCGAPRQRSRDTNPSPNSSSIDFSVPTLKHFVTFTRVTQVLEGYLVAAMQENRRLDHILIHGRAGSGTSVLAHALVRDYAPSRVEELDALTGVQFPKLKRALVRANRRGVVLIRHVELLDPQCAHFLAEYMGGKPLEPDSGNQDTATFGFPWENPRDREIAASARDASTRKEARERLTPGGTVIATALLPSGLSYLLRSRFEQLIHLRNDPKALRAALSRVLRRHGIQIASGAFTRVERVLGSLTESTEQVARAIISRATIEQASVIDDVLMKSILEEDLADRLPTTHYSASLREHLAGRKVKEATPDEVARVAAETGWGESATRDAITTMVRENRSLRRQERPQTPM